MIDKKTFKNLDNIDMPIIKVGDIVEGTVTGITKFGAFIDLPSGERGLAHISEISQKYIKDINECLSVNQKVKVKILNKTDNNRIALSVSKAQNDSEESLQNTENKNFINKKNHINSPYSKEYKFPQNKTQNFENMMYAYVKASEDKISDLNSRKSLRVVKKKKNRPN